MKQMARPVERSAVPAVLRIAWKVLAFASAAGLFWIAGVAAVTGLTTAPGYLGFGFVLALLALGIAFLGWRES